MAAHLVHDGQHLIEGNELADAAQREFGGHQSVGHTGGVSVLAGILHQAAHRVTHQAQHIHEHGGGGVQALLGAPAHKLHGGGGGHSGCHAHLGLAAPHSAGHSGVAHGQIAHGAGVEETV